MLRRERLLAAAALAALAVLGAAVEEYTDEELAAERERVQALAEELVPRVEEATGMRSTGPVRIEVTTRAQVREYLVQLLEEEYPCGELERQGRCLAVFGLLPADYDIRAGLVDLLQEQAGAFYDPRTRAFYSIIDLPEAFRLPLMERLIVAHELTHALQDQAIDLLEMQRADKENTDVAYAHMAVMEGMATVAMFVAAQGTAVESLPNLGGMLRMSVVAAESNPMMQVFATSPRYMQESLISPYADGSVFVQAFLAAEAGGACSDLLGRLPSSSEQILHFDRYVEGDEPTDIDLSGLGTALPPGWTPYFDNVLGELEVKVLCELHEPTSEAAPEIAAGWDGITYSAFADGESLLMLGCSVWDSEADAAEFADGLLLVLGELHGPDIVQIERRGERVSFVIGELQADAARLALERLAEAPARETAGAN